MELSCVAQLYDWGKLGSHSLVAKLLSANKNFRLEENLPYAELWMGTHKNGESTLLTTGETLYNFILRNPLSVGTGANLNDGDLPFLFKVLSIRKSLSIQAHPDKDLAVLLHERYPERYRDSNHKPEMAIAIKDFEALCGFRPIKEIKHFLKFIPEYVRLIPADIVSDYLRTIPTVPLKVLFQSILKAPEDDVKASLNSLINRLKGAVDKVKEAHLFHLLDALNEQHPGDVGIFSIYLLNHIVLNPGEAIFIDSGIPHAYLKGDCVECMACSDNVVRAGLTPKFRDLDTLCEMLNYGNFCVDEMKFKGNHVDSMTTIFKPPAREFAVVRISVPSSEEHMIHGHHSCSLVVIIEGCGKCNEFDVRPGAVIFIPAHMEIKILVTNPLLLFQAFCNL